jgi:hypothetical protein
MWDYSIGNDAVRSAQLKPYVILREILVTPGDDIGDVWLAHIDENSWPEDEE